MTRLNTRQLPILLLKLRKSKGLNQQTIANLLGISKAHYCRIENGERLLQENQIMILAAFYQYDLETFRALDLADKLKEETAKYSSSEVASALKILTNQ